ncbi:MAG: hypothetical protein WC966_03390 [Bradymonadales bacterium]
MTKKRTFLGVLMAMALVFGACDDSKEKKICGNGVIDDGELCDGTDLQGKTCKDFDATKTWTKAGAPACSSDCKSLLKGTCVEVSSKCGDGTIEEDEVCDTDSEGVVSFKGGVTPSCKDYGDANGFEGVTWKDDGEPGCSSDCLGLSKGTCENLSCGDGTLQDNEICDEKDGNILWKDGEGTCEKYAEQEGQGMVYSSGAPGCAKDCRHYAKGTCVKAEPISTCQAINFVNDEENKSITAKANVKYDGEIPHGAEVKFGCFGKTSAINSLQVWGRALIVESGCTEELLCDYDITYDYSELTADEYACVLVVDVDSKLYACGAETSSVATVTNASIAGDLPHNALTIEGQAVEGTILAKWEFTYINSAGYMDQNAFKTELSEGIKPSIKESINNNAKFEHIVADPEHNTTDYKLTTHGSTANPAATANNWPASSTLGTPPYWKVSFSTKGYKNIKLHYAYAGKAGIDITTGYQVGTGELKSIGQGLIIDVDDTWGAFEFPLEDATDADSVTVYVHVEAPNTDLTMRIDDVMITGVDDK